MNYYIDIKVLPDPEFPAAVLMNALFSKLHRTLVETGQGEIGISFPNAQKSLGDKVRLHGSQGALQRFMGNDWRKGLTDYTNATSIAAIPDNCRYRVVERVQAKSSAERMYRRSVKNGRLSAEEAEAKIAAVKDEHLKLPFVQIKSQSTGQSFRLFIRQGSLSDTAEGGRFTSYGLSGNATVPWF